MSKKRIATNDPLLQVLLADPRFEFFDDGTYTFHKRKCKGGNSGDYRSIRYKGRHLSLHRVICTKFHGTSPDPSYEVNHKNGDKQDNDARNLEWVTCSSNQQHKYRSLGNPAVVGHKKINQAVANEIRALRASGSSYDDLCTRFGLAKSTISYIVNQRTWKS